MPAQTTNASQWPQASIAFKGTVSINGYPAGPKDSYMTLGGFLDPNDANNINVTIGKFGSFVSSLVGSGDQLVLGLPGGYFGRGVLIVDQSILYNEAMKSGGYALGLPASYMIRGWFRLSSWSNNGANSQVTPNLQSVPIINTASGYIEFQPSGTLNAPAGFSIARDINGQNVMKVADIDPLLGSTTAGGILVYLSMY